MIELPNAENTVNLVLEPVQVAQESTPVDLSGLTLNAQGVYEVVEKDPSKLQAQKKTQAKVQYSAKQKVLSLDVETTGLNPWEYKMIVCSVWDLDEPKGAMKTFAGWDEEKLTTELFAYIAEKKPEVILAFNAKFECRCFVTRAMQFHLKAPWIWSVEWHDMLTMLEGGWKNGLSGTMPSGTEENWLDYFFGEKKPYNMDECFEGVREGSLERMIIRNRTCVQGQGDMYQLYQYCRFGDTEEVSEEKPSFSRIDEWSEGDPALIKCEVCQAVNEVKESADPGQCWRCLSNLPKPTEANIIKESVRPFDYTKVGLTEKKTTTKKTTTKK